MSSSQIVFSRRLRETPFEQRALAAGARAFTVYNHMPLSSAYQSPQEDYAHLCEHVQIWDVSCERQVEVAGPDALVLVELVTPRDISCCEIGQCMYAPLVDENGGIVNDPIILPCRRGSLLDFHRGFGCSVMAEGNRLWPLYGCPGF